EASLLARSFPLALRVGLGEDEVGDDGQQGQAGGASEDESHLLDDGRNATRRLRGGVGGQRSRLDGGGRRQLDSWQLDGGRGPDGGMTG
ncbi:MAG: hypothetical protein CVU63_10840, partial [Deltaproteobacteria bacterium HGW-Deltaproteobacteria-20]